VAEQREQANFIAREQTRETAAMAAEEKRTDELPKPHREKLERKYLAARTAAAAGRVPIVV
jgi:hypothetical protein